MKGLAIKDVAARTGIAAGTIRMWEQRYGFPEPERTSAGYRVYSEDDVEALRRVLAYRERGLSVPAAVERARSTDLATDRPSLYGVLAAGDPPPRSQLLTQAHADRRSRARSRTRRSRARPRPWWSRAFQRERNYRAVEHRYRAMARTADAVVVFADFDALGGGGDAPVEVPLEHGDALGNEWAVVVDAPGYAACLLGVGAAARRARCRTASDASRRSGRSTRAWCAGRRTWRAALARRADAALGERMDALLDERPLALEQPGAGADRGDEPDRRLLGRRLSRGRDRHRADAVGLR